MMQQYEEPKNTSPHFEQTTFTSKVGNDFAEKKCKQQIAKATDQKTITKLTKLNNLMNIKKGWNTSIILADAMQLMPRDTRTKDYNCCTTRIPGCKSHS